MARLGRMKQEIRFVDLCAGLGGFHYATHLVKKAAAKRGVTFKCVLAADLNPGLREIYLKNFEKLEGKTLRETYLQHYPGEACESVGLDLYDSDGQLARVHGDLRTLVDPEGQLIEWPDSSNLSGHIVPDHDLLMAGFPCQPFSKSGRQEGFEDETRGTVFSLIEAIIRTKKPKYVLLENVGNFESHNSGNTLKTVLQRLEAGGPYEVKYTGKVSGQRQGLLSPHHLGFPHHRERFFLVAERLESGVEAFPQNFTPFPMNYRHPFCKDKAKDQQDAEKDCRDSLSEIIIPIRDRNEGDKEVDPKEIKAAELSAGQVRCIEHWNALLHAIEAHECSRSWRDEGFRPLPSFPIWGFELDPWNHYPYRGGPPADLSDHDLLFQYCTEAIPLAAELGVSPPQWLVSATDGWRWWEEVQACEGEQALEDWIQGSLTRLQEVFISQWKSNWPAYAQRRKWPRWKKQFIEQNRDFAKSLAKRLTTDHWEATCFGGLRAWLDALFTMSASQQKLEWNCQGDRDEEKLDLWDKILQFRPSGLRAKRWLHVPALVALTTTQTPIVPRHEGDREPGKPPSRFLLKQEALELQGILREDSLDWVLPDGQGPAFRALGNAVHAGLVSRVLHEWLLTDRPRRPRRGPPTPRQCQFFGDDSMARPPRKREFIDQISTTLGIDAPQPSGNGAVSKEWLGSLASALGGDPSGSKRALAQQTIRALDLNWSDSYLSRGAAISASFLTDVAKAVRARQAPVETSPAFEQVELETLAASNLASEDLQSFTSEYSDQDVESLIHQISRGDLELSPPWQRSEVWSRARQRQLIESLLVGIPLPAIILHQRADYSKAVIDGKQRLTAIASYVNGDYGLSKGQFAAQLKEGGGHSLVECSGRRFEELPIWAKRKIWGTRLSVVRFRGLRPSMLYRVFELYNTAGTRLNAVEIRNAVYHENPIHLACFRLAGDDGANGAGAQSSERVDFLQQVWDVMGAGVAPGRYAVTDLFERYLAYSRALPVQGNSDAEGCSPGGFRIESTAKVIRRYLDTYQQLTEDSAESVTNELVEVWRETQERFADIDVPAFQVVGRRDGTLKFNRLRATTSLVAGRLLWLLKPSPAQASRALGIAEKLAPIPRKQQTRSIWLHQARYVNSLLEGLDAVAGDLPQPLAQFVEAMHWIEEQGRIEQVVA